MGTKNQCTFGMYRFLLMANKIKPPSLTPHTLLSSMLIFDQLGRRTDIFQRVKLISLLN